MGNSGDAASGAGPRGPRAAVRGLVSITLALLLTGRALALDVAGQAEVQHLLDFVAQSDCSFLRNGEAHSGPDAAEHMRRKFEHFADRIDSAESFIESCGTKSLVSGKAYTVNCPGRPVQQTRRWLEDELEAFRSAGAASPKASR